MEIDGGAEMKTRRAHRQFGHVCAALLSYVLVACSAAGQGAASVTSTPRPSPTATPVRPPTAVPTPRPLRESEEVPGRYWNDVLGVSLTYPETWDILSGAEGGVELLALRDPRWGIVVVLESFVLEEGQEVADTLSSYSGALPGLIGISEEPLLVDRRAYVVGDGQRGLRSMGEGVNEGGDAVGYEILALGRGPRAFFLTIVGFSADLAVREDVLEDVRQGFSVFDPEPFGVPRDSALVLGDAPPETLDPARWHFGADGIVGDLFSGLVQLDASLSPIPDLAERWQVDSTGTVYTFYLRHGVTFHNGTAFTAQDVKYSWERACWPETGSNTAATYLGDIVGVDKVLAGDSREISGVKIIDDYTLEVTLIGPRAYFLAKLAYPASWIVDESRVDQIEEAPVGTGPFSLARYIKDQVIILARNPNYHRGFVPLEYVIYRLYPGPLTRLYETGEVDVAYISQDLLERARDTSDPLYGLVVATNELCTYQAVFDTTRPPFDDRLVRLAFAHAVNRNRYVDVLTGGEGVPAPGLYPPGLPGYSDDVQPLAFDVDLAADLLSQSSYKSASALPEIVLTVSGAGQEVSPSAALLHDMWQTALGVDVQMEQLDSQTFWDQVYAGNHGQIVLSGWCADYPDPENFADVLFHTGKHQNLGGYSDPELDRMLEQARGESDVESRLALYRQIEQRIIDEAPAVFLQHSMLYYTLVKPYIRGFVGTPIGIAQHMNLRIVR